MNDWHIRGHGDDDLKNPRYAELWQYVDVGNGCAFFDSDGSGYGANLSTRHPSGAGWSPGQFDNHFFNGTGSGRGRLNSA